MRPGIGNSEEKKSTTVKNGSQTSSPSERNADSNTGSICMRHILSFLKSKCYWIPQNWSSPNIKTTLRCALVGWLSTVLFVIPSVQAVLGQVSVLIFSISHLVMEYFRQASWSLSVTKALLKELNVSYEFLAAFFSPPSDPFLSVLERETLILTFVAIGWAYV